MTIKTERAVTVAVVGLLLAVMLWPSTPAAQQELVSARDPFAFETITVSTTAIGLTAATISPTNAPGAKQAYCTVEAAAATTAVRWRSDGTVPTAAIGHWRQAGVPGTSDPGEITLEGTNALLRFRAIRQGAADVTLRCTYLR